MTSPATALNTPPGTSSRSEHRPLVAALGSGLLLTMLAFAWSGLAARIEPLNERLATHRDASISLESEGLRPTPVEPANAPWILDDTPP